MKLKFLTKVAPNESSSYEYANLKLIKSDYKEAERYAKKAIEYNKLMLPAYFVLGEVYSIQKEPVLTNEIFYKALENDLNCENLRIEWGKACVRLFDFENARQNFVVALEKNNESENAKIGLALINSLENNFEMLNEVKEKNQANVYIQEAAGLEYVSAERYEDAVNMFKKALKTDPLQTYNLLHLARVYKHLNREDKVREYYEKFTSENPKYKEGLTEYAKWLTEISDFADAKRKLQKAQNIDNQDCEVLNLLFYSMYRLVKENISEYNVKEAISVAEKILTLGGDFKYKPEKQDLETILKNI
jgi:tetratricopeptide (TPR) repeat protein